MQDHKQKQKGCIPAQLGDIAELRRIAVKQQIQEPVQYAEQKAAVKQRHQHPEPRTPVPEANKRYAAADADDSELRCIFNCLDHAVLSAPPV